MLPSTGELIVRIITISSDFTIGPKYTWLQNPNMASFESFQVAVAQFASIPGLTKNQFRIRTNLTREIHHAHVETYKAGELFSRVSSLVDGTPPKHAKSSQRPVWRRLRRLRPEARKMSIMCRCIGTKWGEMAPI